MRMLVAVALLFLQDTSPVPSLLAKINGGSPGEAFKAIADLADLDPIHRAAITKGAADLPAFYRDALIAELAIPPEAIPRVTMAAASRTGAGHLVELARVAGLGLQGQPDAQRPSDGSSPAEFELALERAPLLRALADVCRRTGQCPALNCLTGKVEIAIRPQAIPGFGGRGSAVFFRGLSWTMNGDFSPHPVWTVGLGFTGLVGRPDRVVAWKDARCVEAIGDADVPFTVGRADNINASFGADEFQRGDRFYGAPEFRIVLKATSDAKFIKRLKLLVTAVVAERLRELELRMGGREDPCAVDSEGWRASLSAVEPSPPRMGRIRVRIRAKGISAEDLLGRPCLAEITWADRVENALVRPVRIVEGEVELTLSYWPPPRDPDSVTGAVPNKVRLLVAESVVERPIFAEFRDIPLR